MPKVEDITTEFLEGVEIRTMAKDIAFVQSGAWEKEKEKISERRRTLREEVSKIGELEKIGEAGWEKIKEREVVMAEEQKRRMEEEIRRAKEAKRIGEEEMKRREEERRKAEEGLREKKELQKRMEEEKRRLGAEVRIKEEEERRRTEEERMRMEEEIKKEEEERMRAEEESRRLEEERMRKEDKEREKLRIEEELRGFSKEKRPLEIKKAGLMEKVRQIYRVTNNIASREKFVAEELRKTEEKERLAGTEREKREIEKRRWELEEKRRQIEKERWPWDEQKRRIEEEVGEVDSAIQAIVVREQEIIERQKEILAEEERGQLEKEKVKLEASLRKIQGEKESLEEMRNVFYRKLVEVRDDLRVVLEKERKIEEEKEAFEEQAETATKKRDRQEIERERWLMEEKRRKAEKERWKIEEEKENIENKARRVELNFRRLLGREQEIGVRMKEIETKLSPARKAPFPKAEEKIKKETISEQFGPLAPAEPEQREEEKKIEARPAEEEKGTEERIGEAQKRIAEAKARIEALKKKQKEAEKTGAFEPSEPLQEAEAKKTAAETAGGEEKEEMISQLKEKITAEQKMAEEEKKEKVVWEEAEKQRKEFSERIAEGEQETKKTLPPEPLTIIRPLPEKSSFRERLGIRILILLTILAFISGIIALGYWFFKMRPAPPPPPPLPVEETPKAPEEPQPAAPEIIVPLSLIQAEETISREISGPEEFAALLPEILKTELTENQIGRLVVKNLKDNRVLSLKEFFDSFQIKTPENFLDRLNEDFTLFIYSSASGNRLGLAAEIKEKENLSSLLKDWEKTIEKDMDSLLLALGKEKTDSGRNFRDAVWKKVNFRFLTISKNDLGICYALTDDYFVLTFSFEAMKKAIGRLGIEKQVGQLFLVGFEGKTLTLQTQNFFKKYRPGGVVLFSKNIGTKEQLKKLTGDLQTLSLNETGLPLFIAVDQEGGIISRFASAEEKTAQSEIENNEQAYQVGKKRGEELKEMGFNLNLAPVLDIAKEGDFLFNRTFQKTATQTGELAKALISGQKDGGILTAIKHFPGYGGISFNPEDKLATLEKIPEFPQFKKAMEVGPEFVMLSDVVYNEIEPGLPITFSQAGINFLKENLGSEVIIISDDLSQYSLLNNFSLKEIVIKPLEAGVDILGFSGYRKAVSQGLDEFLAAVKRKEIEREKIEKALSKIIQVKQKLK